MVEGLNYVNNREYPWCLAKNKTPVAIFRKEIDAKIEKRRMQETEINNNLPHSSWDILFIGSTEQAEDVKLSKAQREELRKSKEEAEIRKSMAQLKSYRRKKR